MSVSNSRSSRRSFVKFAAAGAGVAAFGTPLMGLAETVYKFGFNTPANDPAAMEGVKFAKLTEQKARGAIRFETYFNGELSKETDMVTSLQTGLVDATLISTPFLDGKFERLQALSLPFIFPNHASMWKVLDGEVGKMLNADMASRGLLPLAWGAYGVRQFEFTSKPVAKPEDMKGMRLRVIESPIFVSMVKALGAVPVPIESHEILIALQQKTVDGLDFPLASLLATKISSVVKYISTTEHGMNSAVLVMSKKKYDALPADQQKSIVDSAREFLPAWRQNSDVWNTAAAQDCVKAGLTITQVDKAPFRRAMTPVFDEFRGKLGATLIDRILKDATA